ncbi:MAG: glutamate--cysteine ligase [Leptospiraceae bacterium]|nr:glutamate--cysteine ligase [Leptospiraceae bacterium]MDW8305530.1 glutamate--cysteine ligase [Leptospiraceae bacterium]
MFLAERLRLLDFARAEAWLLSQELETNLPFYLSVDIRDSGTKALPVDANLYPAGFNNLHPDDSYYVREAIREAVEKRAAGAQKILILMEEHTRNLWYLENVWTLKQFLESAGYVTEVSTPRDLEGVVYQNGLVYLKTATGNILPVWHFSQCLKRKYDLAILNHDLSYGVPAELEQLGCPICPSPLLGWHRRRKSHFFAEYDLVVEELAKHLRVESFFLRAKYLRIDNIDIFSEKDRYFLAQKATQLLDELKRDYQEHDISENPYLVLKSDHGTYGMGVVTIEQGEELLSLNRREKNRLSHGKGGKATEGFVLQEGIATSLAYEGYPAEMVVYQIDRQVVGQFLRYNTEKDVRHNLNSTGMRFFSFSKHGSFLPQGVLRFYAILSRSAMLAAAREAMRAQVLACGGYEISFSH